mgnify:FL=1
MTSACGVLETVENDGEKPYFQKDDIKSVVMYLKNFILILKMR